MAPQDTATSGTDKSYEVVYTVKLAAGEAMADASIRTGRNARRLRELRFDFDPARYSDFSGDGTLELQDEVVIWNPPRSGGTLRYRVHVPHRRKSGAYDALVTDSWAIFRGDDIFPPAATRVLVGSQAEARLELDLPKGWTAVTPYVSGDDELSFNIRNAARNFDRPTGWILTGDIGVRRSNIHGIRIAIAAPVGEKLRRMDILAFLRWTLPSVVELFPTMDSRILVVGAGDPMWRGGLSGPGSMYVHAERPLISENGTSTILHELVHVAMGVAGANNDDWLVEGIAEYYSIKVLHTSGTLRHRRTVLALEDLQAWGEDVDNLFTRRSSGKITARATTLLAALDAWLLQHSADGRGLDAVVAQMAKQGGTYSYATLCSAARDIMGGPVPMLDPSRVPGAPDLAVCRDTR